MVKVDVKICDQCGCCISICPSDSIVLTGQLQINASTCIKCSKCVKVCPFGALTMDK